MSLISYHLKDFDLVSFNPEALKQYNVVSNYMKWFGDQEVTKYNSHGLFPQSKSEYEGFLKKLDNNELICLAIIDKIKKIHVGNITLQSFNWINRSAELAIVIGEKDYWKKGWGTIALRCLIFHGFMKLNLERIWSGTAKVNKGMIRVMEKLGMKHEGIFRAATFLNGSYVDVVEYAVLKTEYDDIFKEEGKLFAEEGIVN